jgi:hypothetical protein
MPTQTIGARSYGILTITFGHLERGRYRFSDRNYNTGTQRQRKAQVAAKGAEWHMWQHLRSHDGSDSNHEKANVGVKVHCRLFGYDPAAPRLEFTQPGSFNRKASDQGKAAGKTLVPESRISVAHIQSYANGVLLVSAQYWSFELGQLPEAKSVAARP